MRALAIILILLLSGLLLLVSVAQSRGENADKPWPRELVYAEELFQKAVESGVRADWEKSLVAAKAAVEICDKNDSRLAKIAAYSLCLSTMEETGEAIDVFQDYLGRSNKVSQFEMENKIFYSQSPDGKLLALYKHDSIDILDIETGISVNVPQIPSFENSYERFYTFTDDSRRIVCSIGKSIRVYDVATGKLLTVLRGCEEEVNDLNVTSDYISCRDGLSDWYIIWRLSDGKMIFRRNFESSGQYLCPGAGYFLSVDGKTATVLDVKSGEIVVKKSMEFDMQPEFLFSSDGTRLLSVGENRIELLTFPSLESKKEYKFKEKIHESSFDGKCTQGYLTLVNDKKGMECCKLNLVSGEMNRFAMPPLEYCRLSGIDPVVGYMIVSGSDNDSSWLLDTKRDRFCGAFDTEIARSPDGKWILEPYEKGRRFVYAPALLKDRSPQVGIDPTDLQSPHDFAVGKVKRACSKALASGDVSDKVNAMTLAHKAALHVMWFPSPEREAAIWAIYAGFAKKTNAPQAAMLWRLLEERIACNIGKPILGVGVGYNGYIFCVGDGLYGYGGSGSVHRSIEGNWEKADKVAISNNCITQLAVLEEGLDVIYTGCHFGHFLIEDFKGVTDIEFSDRGLRTLLFFQDRIVVFDSVMGGTEADLKLTGRNPKCCELDYDGSFLAVSTLNAIRHYDINGEINRVGRDDTKLLMTLIHSGGAIVDMDYSRECQHLAVVDSGSNLSLYNTFFASKRKYDKPAIRDMNVDHKTPELCVPTGLTGIDTVEILDADFTGELETVKHVLVTNSLTGDYAVVDCVDKTVSCTGKGLIGEIIVKENLIVARGSESITFLRLKEGKIILSGEIPFAAGCFTVSNSGDFIFAGNKQGELRLFYLDAWVK